MTAIHPAPAKPSILSPALTPLINSNLGTSMSLEYGAIVRDVHRAHDLCAEFQRQLAGKATELDEFKRLFEKTQSDLSQLQASIVEMRAERHRLANEAMRAAALRRKVAEITAERDRLLAQLGLAKENDAAPRATVETDGTGAEVGVVLSEMRRVVERLQTTLDSGDLPTPPAQLKRESAPGENSRP